MFIRVLPFILFNQTPGDAPTGAGATPPPAPTVTPAPAAAQPAPTAPTPSPPLAAASQPATPPAPEKDPNWLNERIARAQKNAQAALLKDLGLESIDDAKAAVNDLKAKREAEKTTAQKAAEYENKLKAVTAQNESLSTAVATYAAAQMGTLSDPQKAAVVAIAGEDPAKQLTTIEALRPTWKTTAPAGTDASSASTQQTAPGGAPAPALAPAPGTAAPQPRPADTAPAPNAPKDTTTTPLTDPKAVYAELKKTNPVIAARFALANGVHDTP